MVSRWWIIIGLVISGGALRAQEVEVPVDSAGRIPVINADLARRLDLFSEVEAFREARLFRLPDSTYVLEITSAPRGRLQRSRRAYTTAEAEAFRRDLAARVNARAPTAVLDQSGRTKLLVGSTILGLGFYGPATAAAFDPDDSQTAVALYMITGASSFFLPFLITKTQPISDPVASMAIWGMMRGPVHGLLIAELGDANSDKTKFGWAVATGAAEGIVGGMLARSLRMTPGRAELTGVGGDLGMSLGLGISNLARFDRRTRWVRTSYPGLPPDSFPADDNTLQSLTMLATSGLGLAAGYRLGASGDWTRGDAVVFRNTALIGALTGLAVGDLIHQPRLVTESYPGGTYSYYADDFSRPHSIGGILGMAAGGWLGQRLVQDRNFTGGQGTLLTLSPLAGGLVGLGIAYLSTPEEQYYYAPGPNPPPYRDPNDHSELYLTMSAVGAAAGFAALYPALSRSARGTDLGSNFEFSFNPLAAAQLAGGAGSVALGSVTYRF